MYLTEQCFDLYGSFIVYIADEHVVKHVQYCTTSKTTGALVV